MNAIVVFVVFFAIFSGSEAIRCYECSLNELGVGDPKCDDPIYDPDPPYLKDCDPDVYTKCRKTKTYLANDKVSIVRECAVQTCSDKGCKQYDGQTVCELCCYGDMCNGADSVTSDLKMATLLMATGLTLLLY